MRSASHGQYKNKFIEHILQYLRVCKIKKYIFKKAKLLDIGCGYNGNLLTILRDLDIDGYGVDLYVDANNYKLRAVDLNNLLPFEDNTFDIVTCLAVLEHLQNNNIFNEMYRILKVGGILLLTTPTIYSKPILEILAYNLNIISIDEISDHKHYYIKKELISLMQYAGFKEIKISIFNFG